MYPLMTLKQKAKLTKIHFISDKQIFRQFIVDKVLPLQIEDLRSFGTALGYDPTALKLPRECLDIIKNPFWQIVKFWTELTEDLQYVCLPLMYCSLMNIKQKVIANELIESVMVHVHYTDRNTKTSKFQRVIQFFFKKIKT